MPVKTFWQHKIDIKRLFKGKIVYILRYTYHKISVFRRNRRYVWKVGPKIAGVKQCHWKLKWGGKKQKVNQLAREAELGGSPIWQRSKKPISGTCSGWTVLESKSIVSVKHTLHRWWNSDPFNKNWKFWYDSAFKSILVLNDEVSVKWKRVIKHYDQSEFETPRYIKERCAEVLSWSWWWWEHLASASRPLWVFFSLLLILFVPTC